MLISEVFDQLIYGDLNNLAITEDGCIDPSNYPLIINAINLGLTELHKRFPLKLKEVYVQQHIHISTYTLHSKYALSNTTSTEPIKYIIDSDSDPFVDDILMIESVYNEEGEEYYLNDDNAVYSLYTPSWNTLQIPDPQDENAISIVYRANHRRIDPNALDLDDIEIDIPHSLLSPLLLYVAYRIYDSRDKLNGTNNSNNILNKFEAALIQAEMSGLITQENPTNFILENSGWV